MNPENPNEAESRPSGGNPSNNGGGLVSALSPDDISRFRAALLQKRSDLSETRESQLTQLAAVEGHHLADLEEMSSDGNGVESLCEIMDIEGSTVVQIDAAIVRIDDGTYGACEECGKSIPIARLEALPFTAVCIDCQRLREENPEITS